MTRPIHERPGCVDPNADDTAGTATVRQLFSRAPRVDSDAVEPTTEALQAQVRGLQERQLTLAAIEQAKGMLMGYYGVPADTAFAILVHWSQQSNTKLREVADAFVTDAGQPSSQPYGSLRATLRAYAEGVQDVIARYQAAG